MKGTSNHFLFHFEVNPLSQAVEMNSATWTWALAWVEEEILITIDFFQTDFAGIFLFRLMRVIFEDFPIGVGMSLDAERIGS